MEYTVAAVHEALSVLMHVAHAPGLGVTEIARRSGNTKARTFRLLTTLEQSGFVQRGPTDTDYVLGPIALVLGLAAQEQVSLARLGRRHLEALGQRFDENVQIRVRDGLVSVTVVKWDSSQGVRVHSDIGVRRALHAGASGKLLLAFAPEALQQQVLDGPLERFTPQTLSQRAKLAREIAQVREQGYAVSKGEVFGGVVAAAVPVLDARGEVIAALGMSIPEVRAPADLAPHVDALTRAAQGLSRELGWPG
ncbi:IclR family transcriptional regulator [Aquincola sp. S2]|uniref:IclR family transcriptional regulator n=1 Tax=Pseudaquabacterium terrae TaxID=2732868 RepID=A0ABX2ENK7_9BURK|nr:IclR family transcriptional regulator [Aquabacterium terrae]NRF70262.1 IclR family transcriptional regulator [Aquabacterium terrae]